MDDALSFIIEAQELGLLPGFPEPRLTLAEWPEKVPGHCRYCGKPMARGIWAHEKSCARKQ